MKIGNEFLIVIKPHMFERAKDFLVQIFEGDVFIDDRSYLEKRSKNGVELCISEEENAPTEEEYAKGIWLSCETDDFEGTKKDLVEFGVTVVTRGDPEAFFFHLPGEPVFKLINT